VQSEVIRLDPFPPEQRPDPHTCHRVERLLKQAFLARRKMLRNTLKVPQTPSELETITRQAGIDLRQRPQEVAPSAWVKLARGLNQADSAASSS